MYQKVFIPLLGCLFVAVGCEKKIARAPSTDAQATAAPKFDACELIKGEEIQAIQGSPIKDTKSSGNSNGRLRVSQCYFSAEESNKSVSLAVTQNDPANHTKDFVKEAWEQSFARGRSGEKESKAEKEKKESLREQEHGREEEERAPPLKKVEGIGDEAYWVGSRVGGALYVLGKDAFIRISVGGPDEEQGKIDKSKALAEKALRRL